MSTESGRQSYWRANLKVVTFLLAIWFFISIVCSIFLIEPLNAIKVGKVGLGFWLAQQGSIFSFILIVLVYALWMDRLDKKFEVRD